MHCTRCDGTGFLNLEQIEDDAVHDGGFDEIMKWLKENDGHEVGICDCCGDGDGWYGEPGETSTDPNAGGWDTPGVPGCI